MAAAGRACWPNTKDSLAKAFRVDMVRCLRKVIFFKVQRYTSKQVAGDRKFFGLARDRRAVKFPVFLLI